VIEVTAVPEGTPLGGVLTVTAYLDPDGVPCERAEAVTALVSEYDAAGNWLGETVLRAR
jgi:hypothetical protein